MNTIYPCCHRAVKCIVTKTNRIQIREIYDQIPIIAPLSIPSEDP